VQVFAAHVVVDADDAALYKGKGTFHGVCMHIAPRVLSGFVADVIVTAAEFSADAPIGREFIADDSGGWMNDAADFSLERFSGHVRNHAAANFPAALYGCEHSDLPRAASKLLRIPKPGLASDIGSSTSTVPISGGALGTLGDMAKRIRFIRNRADL